MLHDYYTNACLRVAKPAELEASRNAAKHDGGSGVILLTSDGRIVEQDDRESRLARRVYVAE
jgi:hypothetical protein